jgi:TPR repeat protein
MQLENIDSLIETSSFMPDYFWKELRASNQAKAAHIPLALVLQAEEDKMGVFSSAVARAEILTIAKTHRIAFKMIRNQEELREKIRETKQQANRFIDCLVIRGHGNPDSIALSEGEEYTVKDLRKEDFDSISKTGNILLSSCYTGQLLAPQLAKIAGRDVVAPLVEDNANNTIPYFCEKHGWEASSIRDGDQIIRIFHPEQEPTMPCIEHPSRSQTLEALLIKDAELGDLQSQCELGLHYLHGVYLEKSSTQALYWLTQAVKGGSILAQTLLGAWHLQDSNEEAGMQYLRSAASAVSKIDTLNPSNRADALSGGITACIALSKIYKALGCTEEDLETLCKVAEKIDEIDFLDGEIFKNLGDLCMDQKNYEKAYDCYTNAIENGCDEAHLDRGKMKAQGLHVEASLISALWDFEYAEKNGSPEVAALATIEIDQILLKHPEKLSWMPSRISKHFEDSVQQNG